MRQILHSIAPPTVPNYLTTDTPLCRPLLDQCAECFDWLHLCIGVSRHRGLCAAVGSGQSRHDWWPVFRLGFRRRWVGCSPARDRGRRSGHHLCLLAMFLHAIAWAIDCAASPHSRSPSLNFKCFRFATPFLRLSFRLPFSWLASLSFAGELVTYVSATRRPSTTGLRRFLDL